METIRILQDTYEKLYAITPALAKLVEKTIPRLPEWEKHFKTYLTNRKVRKPKWDNFWERDSYYLLQSLDANWDDLALYVDSQFFCEENKRWFITDETSLLEIRNEIAHPENIDYNYRSNTYHAWNKTFDKAARALKTDMKTLLADLHRKEKENLLHFIFSQTSDITLASNRITPEIRELVENTKKRMQAQSTAAGIIAFFTDALESKKGQELAAKIHALGLPLFEDIKDQVFARYYGINEQGFE